MHTLVLSSFVIFSDRDLGWHFADFYFSFQIFSFLSSSLLSQIRGQRHYQVVICTLSMDALMLVCARCWHPAFSFSWALFFFFIVIHIPTV